MTETLIKLRRSAVPGKTPTDSQLELGEVAINTYDGKMYFKQAAVSNTILQVATTSLNLGQFASTTSAQLANTISDETGIGSLVFGTSPTLVTPVINGNTTFDSGTLFIDSVNNRVGVNTISPTQALHVVGNARITGGIADSNGNFGTPGQVLASNTTGTYWTTSAAVGTNLSTSSTSNTITVNSDTGSDAVILGATTTTAGLITTAAQSFSGNKIFTGSQSLFTNYLGVGESLLSNTSPGNYDFEVFGRTSLWNGVDISTDLTGPNPPDGLYTSYTFRPTANTTGSSRGVSLGTSVFHTAYNLTATTGGGGAVGFYNYLSTSGNAGTSVSLATGVETSINKAGSGSLTSAVGYNATASGAIGTYYGFRQQPYASATNAYGFYSDIVSGTNQFNFYANGTAPNYFAGNVGIGISNPLAKLDVYQSSAVAGLASARFGVNAGGGSPASLSGLTTYWNLSDGFAESSLVYGNSPLSFMTFGKHNGTSYSETMRIAANGNIGISTTAPIYRLDVNTTTLGAANNDNIQIAKFSMLSTNGDSLTIRGIRKAAGADWTTAVHRIERVVDVTPMGYIQFGDFSSGGDLITFGEGSAEYARIDGSGNVGIGIAAPTERLHVEGNTRSLSFASANGSAGSPAFDFAADPNTGMFLLGVDTLGFSTNGSPAAAFTSTGDLRLYNTAGNRYITISNQPTANVTVTIPVLTTNSSLVLSEGTATIDGIKTFSDLRLSGPLTNTGTNSRDKLRVWSNSPYTIGMSSPFTFGALNNDYAMTFQMNNDDDRGFWWGDEAHANNQGAMALSTDGKLTVANSIRVGYGESDSTIPGSIAPLEVNGNIYGARIRMTATADAHLTSDLHALQIGSNTGINMVMDNNEIQVRNGGAAGAMYIQGSGGDLFLGTASGTGTTTFRHAVNEFPLTADGKPSITFTGDTNTGFGTDTADVLKVFTGGVEVANFGSSGNFNSNFGITAKKSSNITADISYGEGLFLGVNGTTPSAATRYARIGVYGQGATSQPAGYIALHQLDGGVAYIWNDNSAVLRISTAVSGVGLANTGTVVGTQTSDERLKDIDPIFKYGIEEVRQLKPIHYRFKNDNIPKIGFGAQTTQPIIPESVYDTGECIDGYVQVDENDDTKVIPASDRTKLAMDYEQITPVLTAAIQQLDKMVQNLSERVTELETKINNGL